uniref:Uncharacterized protein n=1 Tax=Corvus moneduloides TaxID=1196302 RepID=A0A8C3GTC6_CORMO
MSYYYEQCKQPCLPPPICLQKCGKCVEPCATKCVEVCQAPSKCHQVHPSAKCHQGCPSAKCHQVHPSAKCHQGCPSAKCHQVHPSAKCHQGCPSCHQGCPSAKCHQVCPSEFPKNSPRIPGGTKLKHSTPIFYPLIKIKTTT